MEEQLKTIVKHFGINNQQRKLQEEIFELQEAITCYELNNSVSYDIPLCELSYGIDSIKEEMADVMVILNQFIEYYKIEHKELFEICNKKVDRTIERIDSGYYESNDRKITE